MKRKYGRQFVRHSPDVALVLHAALLAYWIFEGYFRSDAMFLAGLGVIGFSLVLREPGAGSWRFGLLALLFVGLSLWVPARSFHFMTLIFSAFFVVENYWGRMNIAPVFTAMLLTAGAKTMSIVLGFPMRLQLSENAATVLRFLGKNASAAGNLIQFDGKDFLVDAACAGLQMVEVSFLFCFFLMGLLERQTGRQLSGLANFVLIVGTAILILIFNQLRIIFLVIFNIPPENPMHELLGIFGLALYVFVPLWYGMKWVFNRPGNALTEGTEARSPGHFKQSFSGLISTEVSAFLKKGTQVVLMTFLIFFALFLPKEAHLNKGIGQTLTPVGMPENCQKEILPGEVVKYTNDQVLIYVKPIKGWYDTEHTPLICWQGSGYEFGQIEERMVGKTTLYTGTLEKKGAPPYFTAWWFDNGSTQTISQARWRWLDAGGSTGFSLVNVTTDDPAMLEQQLAKMIHDQ